MLAGGTDLAGQIDRGIRSPSLLVDLQDAGLGRDRGRRRRRADRRDDDALRARRLRAARAVRGRRDGRRPRRLAAPAQPGHGRRQPLPAHALLVLPRRGVDVLARRRRHLLRPDRRPPQAQPGGGRLHLRPPVRPRAGARRRRGATVVVRSADGERELPLLELYRRPTEDNRSLVTLAVGEIVVAVRLPAPPDASVYLRTGERQAFSFPLVSVAAARTGDAITLAAAGVANIPRSLDPADPLAGLPGHPAERVEADGADDARRARDRRPPGLSAGARHGEDVRDVDELPRRAARSARTPPGLRSRRSRPRDRLRC